MPARTPSADRRRLGGAARCGPRRHDGVSAVAVIRRRPVAVYRVIDEQELLGADAIDTELEAAGYLGGAASAGERSSRREPRAARAAGRVTSADSCDEEPDTREFGPLAPELAGGARPRGPWRGRLAAWTITEWAPTVLGAAGLACVAVVLIGTSAHRGASPAPVRALGPQTMTTPLRSTALTDRDRGGRRTEPRRATRRLVAPALVTTNRTPIPVAPRRSRATGTPVPAASMALPVRSWPRRRGSAPSSVTDAAPSRPAPEAISTQAAREFGFER